jgi:hypothetical protein
MTRQRAIRVAGLVLALAMVGCGPPARTEQTTAQLPSAVAKASAAFQTGLGGRYPNDCASARTLLPWIEAGMTRADLKSLLGPPDRATDDSWYYVLFYSMYLDVRFDASGKIQRVSSPLLQDKGTF